MKSSSRETIITNVIITLTTVKYRNDCFEEVTLDQVIDTFE